MNLHSCFRAGKVGSIRGDQAPENCVKSTDVEAYVPGVPEMLCLDEEASAQHKVDDFQIL